VGFSEKAGATALHPDLVYALAFSQETLPLESTGVPTRAALVGVWNGERGLAVVILRQVEPPNVRRFQFDRDITSLEALDEAVVQACAFAGEFGFQMDDPRYRDLTDELRAERFQKWEGMRKVRKPRARRSPFAEADAPARSGSAGQAAPTNFDGESTRAILGRVALVRRGSRKALARILGSY
jgi:hypothetical protein